MRLRSNKLLKFFAILLFSFEMIAPALVTSATSEVSVKSDDQTSLSTTTSHLASLMSSLLFEETNNEEERESKDHKTTLCFTDFGFIQPFIELTTTETRQTSWLDKHERRISQPPLFALTHSYII
jgi:hypothetical protein